MTGRHGVSATIDLGTALGRIRSAADFEQTDDSDPAYMELTLFSEVTAAITVEGRENLRELRDWITEQLGDD